MTHLTRSLTKLALSFSLLAVPVSLAAHARPAEPATTSAMSLGDRLAAVGRVFADETGAIALTTIDDETIYVATAAAQQPFAFYFVGDRVDEAATMAACEVDVAGGPTNCDLGYGEPLLFGLEDLIAEDPNLDPTAMKLQCDHHINVCRVTWFDGSERCYGCANGHCDRLTCP